MLVSMFMVQCITVKLVEREKVASAHVRISKHAKQLFSTTFEKKLTPYL